MRRTIYNKRQLLDLSNEIGDGIQGSGVIARRNPTYPCVVVWWITSGHGDQSLNYEIIMASHLVAEPPPENSLDDMAFDVTVSGTPGNLRADVEILPPKVSRLHDRLSLLNNKRKEYAENGDEDAEIEAIEELNNVSATLHVYYRDFHS